MATITSLRSRLRTDSKISANHISDDDMDVYLTNALATHDSSLGGSFLFLPAQHEEPVVILAWIHCCYVMASRVADEPNLNLTRVASTAMGQDRSTPHDKWLSLAAALEKRYQRLTSMLGGAGVTSTNIVQGTLYRKDDLTDLHTDVPLPTLHPAVLTIGAPDYDNGAVIVEWSENPDNNFDAYYLFTSSAAGIHAKWDSNTATGIPEVLANATKIWTSTLRTSNSVKITDLVADTVYYFLLVTRSNRGEYAYSNEVSVDMTEPEPDPVPDP